MCDGDILHFKQWYWPKMRLKVSQEPPYFHTAKLSKTLKKKKLMIFIWVQQANSLIPAFIPAT